jgi:Holliday junction resolvase RusA-like endonuclease
MTAQVVTGRRHVAFLVIGTPAPQGSKIAVAKGVLRDDNPIALRTWREDVKQAALACRAEHDDIAYLDGPLLVMVTFSLRRPQSHHRASKRSNGLRIDAPIHSSSRPDLDKLLRSTLDAITTSGLIGDDGQIAELRARKRFVNTAVRGADGVGAVVVVERLER